MIDTGRNLARIETLLSPERVASQSAAFDSLGLTRRDQLPIFAG